MLRTAQITNRETLPMANAQRPVLGSGRNRPRATTADILGKPQPIKK